jgi:hypothetical protein
MRIFIALDRNRPFDGVFAHLWRHCGKNPHDAGLTEIFANDESLDGNGQEVVSSGRWFISGDAAVDLYAKIDDDAAVDLHSVKTHGIQWA